MGKLALVVDDSASTRRMVAFALQEAGFDVLEGENGRAGLAQLDGHQVQLIITDLQMPIMDGISFIREVRALRECTAIPILMLTNERQEAKKLEGKAAGATGWLVKPVSPEQLMEAVTAVCP